MMKKITARIVGNALFAFAASFSAVQLVTEGRIQGVAISAGLITATIAGVMAAARELIDYGNNGGKKPTSRKETAKNMIRAMTLF